MAEEIVSQASVLDNTHLELDDALPENIERRLEVHIRPAQPERENTLHEERVALVPGSAFGEAGQGFVRCSYATAYEKIEEALERLHRFVRRHG